MSTTIRDVAKELKVSVYTVSRALDGYDDVSDQTRQLVIETANKMGYVPNRAARQLRRQKAETIGFIIPPISKRFNEPFFTEFIAGLGDQLSSQDFDLLVSSAGSNEAEQHLYHRWVSSHKVDGFVLNRIHKHDWRMDYLSKLSVPFVALGRSQNQVKYPCVRIEAAEEYVSLVKHIQQNGFKRFAYIGGPNYLVNQIDRRRWFNSAIKTCGLEVSKNHIVSTDMSSTAGYEAAMTLLSGTAAPNAVLCVNDETAFGALHAAHELGYKVGRDIAVTGFEGVQDARHTEPPLTTLDIPIAEVACQLASMLLKILGGKPIEAREVVIRPVLVTRASTGGQLLFS